MPELPEVETIRHSLEVLVTGRVIDSVDVSLPRIIRQPSVDEFCARLCGMQIHGVSRKGKYLLFDLGNHVLISHLRMEGRGVREG